MNRLDTQRLMYLRDDATLAGAAVRKRLEILLDFIDRKDLVLAQQWAAGCRDAINASRVADDAVSAAREG